MKSLIKLILNLGLTSIIALNISGAATADRKQEQQQLLQTLQSNTNLHAKVLACKRLALIGDEEAIPVLAKLLEDEQLHHMARFALEPNPSPLVDRALRDSLNKLKGKLLIGSINSIGIRRDANAVPQLIKFLQSEDAEIAGAAGAALGRVATVDSAKALRKAVQQAKGSLQEDLAQSTILCAERLYAENKKKEAIDLFDFLRKSELPRHIKMAATRGAILAREENGLPLLIEQIKSNDDGMFAVGLRVTREFNYKNATKALVSLYEEMATRKTDPRKLAIYLEALGDRMDKLVSPLAIKILNENNPPVLQLAAIKVIGKLGEESATATLLKTATKSEKEVSQAAYNCLITLGGRNVEQTISETIGGNDDATKLVAIKIASERNISGAIPNMVLCLKSPEKSVRTTAVSALGSICGQSEIQSMLNYLLTASDKDEIGAAEQAITTACSRISDKENVSKMLMAAYSKAPESVKPIILKLFVQTPTDSALQTVKSALKDSNAAISEAAARSLCEWQSAVAIDDILNLASASENETIKILAIRGSVRLLDQSDFQPERKTSYLRKALDLSKREEEKKIVLSALGNCPTVDALKMASNFLSTPTLKNEAAAALIAVGQKLAKTHPQEVKTELKNLLTQDFDQLTRKKVEEILNSIK